MPLLCQLIVFVNVMLNLFQHLTKKVDFRNKFEMTVSQLICETDLGSSVGLCKLA